MFWFAQKRHTSSKMKRNHFNFILFPQLEWIFSTFCSECQEQQLPGLPTWKWSNPESWQLSILECQLWCIPLFRRDSRHMTQTSVYKTFHLCCPRHPVCHYTELTSLVWELQCGNTPLKWFTSKPQLYYPYMGRYRVPYCMTNSLSFIKKSTSVCTAECQVMTWDAEFGP